ncbi:MW1434 family type I TA system toxin [Streptomyces sp. NPDC051907]|uniref:Thoeris anti-defense Tad2 family protein n=1 Tax=Streptomyces sp. NPDC051907 TaxID=3155284 RepID=UPI0034376D81
MTETKTSRRTSDMKFEEALAAMRGGDKVARAGWIQPDKWVRLVPARMDEREAGRVHASYFEFKQGDGSLVPWTLTHNGVLSEDWYVVE